MRLKDKTVLAICACALVIGGCGTSQNATTSAASLEEGASTAAGASNTAVATSHPRSTQPPADQRSQAAGRSSSSAVLGHRTKSTACQIRGLLPDPACTPGAVFAGATVSQVCTPGYSRSVRNVPESVKHSVYAEYGIASHVPGSYEVDHLVSLELGGSNSVANLWPEISPGYHEKDGIENRLHDAVCAGSVRLHSAQVQIARDWRHTSAGAPTIVEHATPSGPSTRTSAPASSTPADFCSTHECIPSFSEGRGTIVQCADGEWSHSGGRPGVCSRHGGPR
jgi:hypothetical protein